MKNGEREWSRTLSEEKMCIKTGKYVNEYGTLWVEIEIEESLYWVNNLALEHAEKEITE